jgi:hypothetical protein
MAQLVDFLSVRIHRCALLAPTAFPIIANWCCKAIEFVYDFTGNPLRPERRKWSAPSYKTTTI